MTAQSHTVPGKEFLFIPKKRNEMKSNKLVFPNKGKRPCVFNDWKPFCG